ncbi:hypothetical protein ScPMuIL_002714 [Solemya velum]
MSVFSLVAVLVGLLTVCTGLTNADPPICIEKMDLILLIDESTSVGDNFINLRNFVKDLLHLFLIHPDMVRVGLISFGSKVRITESLRLKKS